MGKKAKKLPEDKKKIALANGISLRTVYARIDRGWPIDRAITEPVKAENTPISAQIGSRQEGGLLKSPNKKPKGKLISFTPYRDDEKELYQLIAESGKSRSVFISEIIHQWLQARRKKK